jgi:hypothetical protein
MRELHILCLDIRGWAFSKSSDFFNGSIADFFIQIKLRQLLAERKHSIQAVIPEKGNSIIFNEWRRTLSSSKHLKGQCHEIFCVWFFS